MRGEVYWWKFGDSVGSEEGAVRPGVIVSSEQGNKSSSTVNIVFLTTKPKYGRINVELAGAERRSWAMCNQIATVDKLRAGNYMSTLSEEEMADIDSAIMIALGLHNVTDEEDESDNDEIEAMREEIASLKHSGFAWKKLYEKALEEITSLRFEADMAKRATVAPKVAEPAIEKPKVAEPEPEPLVDLNSCSESDLRKCGCDPTLIKSIIARRPYKKVEDLRFVPGLKSVGYAILKAKVCIAEAPVEKPKNVERVPKVKPQKVETPKLNINTCTAKELVGLTGLHITTMCAITGHRNRNGEYTSVSELAKLERLPKNFLERFGDKLTV